MKQLLPVAFLAAILSIALQCKATIRRVGYFGTATAIDYPDLQSAHDASAAGDSIYLYPGSWSANISQKIILIGYGYNINPSIAGANTGLQNIVASLSVQIYLYAGSDNSVFDGLDGFNLNNNNMNGTSTGIIIKHCNISSLYLANAFAVTNWQILQSFMNGSVQIQNGYVNNLKVTNCIFQGAQYSYGAGTNTGQYVNCVFGNAFDLGGGNFIVKNCIMATYTASNDANCVYTNCIQNSDYGTSANFPTGTNGNQAISFGTTPVFNTGSTSNDGQYTITTGSPAKGAGASGVDCGAFGGPNPYVLSGLPAMPAFTLLTAPSSTTSTNPYTITFSVQSH